VGLRSSSMPGYYWVIFDNFRLCYYGSVTPDEVDGIATPAITEQPSAVKKGVYTLDGRQIDREYMDVNTLPAGIYIVDGKKVVIGQK